MTKTESKPTLKETLQGSAILLICLFLLGRCAYSVTGPHTCNEARQREEAADKEYETARGSYSGSNPSSEEFEDKFLDAKIALDDRTYARQKVSELCY